VDISLKPLDQQVIVITGASSGIGLAIAEAAARSGAELVLAARSAHALEEIVTRLNAHGAGAIAVPCDVAELEQVETLAQTAISSFERIDTWVNNAGVSIDRFLEEVSEADSRRLFDTNFWGVYHGSMVALPYLKASGGALINVGSEVSDAVIPLQGIYSASKHAVKGFTDALRVEVQEVEQAPVAITLIQPTAVNTPYPQHAKNYMEQEPKLPSPQVDPSDVAQAILEAATTSSREKKVGVMATVNTTMAKIVPSLGAKISAKLTDKQQYMEEPRHPQGALYHASETTTVVGQTHGTGGVERP